MGRYILKRIVGFIPVLFVVALLAFIIGRLAPGNSAATSNPYQNYESANSLAQRNVSQKVIDASGLRLPVFYIVWKVPPLPLSHTVIPIQTSANRLRTLAP